MYEEIGEKFNPLKRTVEGHRIASQNKMSIKTTVEIVNMLLKH